MCTIGTPFVPPPPPPRGENMSFFFRLLFFNYFFLGALVVLHLLALHILFVFSSGKIYCAAANYTTVEPGKQ